MSLIVKILDTEDNSVKWITKYPNASSFWWSEGNGCCDCNRRISFERETDEYTSGDDNIPCTSYRYYIIDTFEGGGFSNLINDYKYDFDKLHLYNGHYNNYTEIFHRINKLRDREDKINEILDD